MNSFELENLIRKIVGLRLTVIGYACNMPMFNFGNSDVSYSLHAQCLTRIIKNDDILVTTYDYQSWDGEHDEKNDFMYNLKKFKPEIEGGLVVSVEVNALFDATITLDNGVVIQIIIDNSYSHYDEAAEQYRFFECGSDDEDESGILPPHYVVYSKRIEIQG
ncbi:MAG: hypothetical protein K2O41_05400 [Clostridia bacterium]|nr:hypothetical protein [Clostridia bacterium]